MAEDVARIVGARSPEVFVIAGKECRPRPLTISEIAELERECLSQYRRSYLRTFSENIDLLPKEEGRSLLREKMEEAARFTINTLPIKHTYVTATLRVNAQLTEWLEENVDDYSIDATLTDKERETYLKRVASLALDSGMLDEQEYTRLTNHKPKKIKLPYVSWWTTGTSEGMIAMVWLVVSEAGLTKAEVAKALSDDPTLMLRISREIEGLSAPGGNV